MEVRQMWQSNVGFPPRDLRVTGVPVYIGNDAIRG